MLGVLLKLALLSSLGLAYDSSLQYSPQGRVLQVEYAKRRTDKGSPVIGIKCSDGVLLVSIPLRPKNKLHVRHLQKVFLVDQHVCLAATGLLVDAKGVVEAAKKLCLQYRIGFQSNIPIEQLASELAALMHAQTRRLSSRPLGVSLLVVGFDDDLGSQVYQINPEGTLDAWRAVSIGSNSQQLMTHLEQLAKQSRIGESSIDESWMALKSSLQKEHKRLLRAEGDKPETPIRIEVSVPSSYDQLMGHLGMLWTALEGRKDPLECLHL